MQYAYRKMMAAKMLFVRFWGGEKHIGAADPSTPVATNLLLKVAGCRARGQAAIFRR